MSLLAVDGLVGPDEPEDDHREVALTDELEAKAAELIARIDELGGAVAAIEAGWVQQQIEESAFRWQQEVERGERVIVGVNRYAREESERIQLHQLDPATEQGPQVDKAQYDKIMKYIGIVKEQGATMVSGGRCICSGRRRTR